MKIILAASMSAAKEMVDIESALTARGHEVILPAFTHEYAKHQKDGDSPEQSIKDKIEHDLIRTYFHKIEDSDAILVVNVDRKGIDGYVGGNAFLELGFAYVLRKKLFLWKAIPIMSYADEIIAMQPFVLDEDITKIQP